MMIAPIRNEIVSGILPYDSDIRESNLSPSSGALLSLIRDICAILIPVEAIAVVVFAVGYLGYRVFQVDLIVDPAPTGWFLLGGGLISIAVLGAGVILFVVAELYEEYRNRVNRYSSESDN